MRCVPVKNGWHTEHTSVFSSVSVEPVVKVLPQRQWTSASTWYSGWIAAFIGAPRFTRKGRVDDTTLVASSIQRHGHRPGEVAMGNARKPVDEVLVRGCQTDAVRREQPAGAEHVDEPVVVAVQGTPLNLLRAHRHHCPGGAIELVGGISESREGEQVEAHLAAGAGHDPAAFDHILDRVAHR